MLKRRLKATAFPRIFSSCPEYLSQGPTTSCSTPSASESHRAHETSRIEELIRGSIEQDSVSDLRELQQKMETSTTSVPGDIVRMKNQDGLIFLYVGDSCDRVQQPTIKASVVASENLCVFILSAQIPKNIRYH